jgi:hypothetical protein
MGAVSNNMKKADLTEEQLGVLANAQTIDLIE